MSEVYCSILPMKDFEIQLSINADTYTLLSSGHLHVVTTLVTVRLDRRFAVVYTWKKRSCEAANRLIGKQHKPSHEAVQTAGTFRENCSPGSLSLTCYYAIQYIHNALQTSQR